MYKYEYDRYMCINIIICIQGRSPHWMCSPIVLIRRLYRRAAAVGRGYLRVYLYIIYIIIAPRHRSRQVYIHYVIIIIIIYTLYLLCVYRAGNLVFRRVLFFSSKSTCITYIYIYLKVDNIGIICVKQHGRRGRSLF